MEKIKAVFYGKIILSNSMKARELYERSSFGVVENDKIVYMPEEAFFLFEEKKLDFFSEKLKMMSLEEVFKKLTKQDKDFYVRYSVFKDLRKKGFLLKSGLKFGCDFRVYDKGSKLKKSHSKWLCFCEKESESIKLKEFALRGRVVNSTKKSMLLAIVDNEGDVSYYETNWKKIS